MDMAVFDLATPPLDPTALLEEVPPHVHGREISLEILYVPRL